ncbi:hypothetical protein QA601_18450, partial [Chitinispirillales bacterium ANBcel5]|uniref:hypothetical protein n=1 Tax=Cellulosispirillum alkaliphilum TaxID=3039283 RepID=UPI002A4E9B5D|nr:hypothetical protein [Chitinispirillales bacterium ANBcel5]
IELHSDITPRLIESIAIGTSGNLWTVSIQNQDFQFVARYDGTEWEFYNAEDGGLSHSVSLLELSPVGIITGVGPDSLSQFVDGNWSYVRRVYASSISDFAFFDSTQFILVTDNILDNYISGYRIGWHQRGWIQGNNTRFIGVDHNNNLWVTPDRHPSWGLHRYDGSEWSYYSTNDVMLHNTVRTFAVDSSGGKWFGGPFGFTHLKGEHSSRYWENRLGDLYDINDCVVSKDNVLWAACIGGVLSYEFSGWRSYDHNEGFHKHDNSTPLIVYSIETFDNTIVAGMSNGISWLRDGVFVKDTTPEAPQNRAIWALKAHPSEQIIAATSNGLFMKSKKMPWRQLLGDDANCSDIEIDLDGRIWVATRNQGIFVFNEAGNQLFQFTTEHGLLYHYIYNLAQSHHGPMWVGSGDGLIAMEVFWTEDNSSVTNPKVTITRKPISQFRNNGIFDLRGRKQTGQSIQQLRSGASGMYIYKNDKGDNLKRIELK